MALKKPKNYNYYRSEELTNRSPFKRLPKPKKRKNSSAITEYFFGLIVLLLLAYALVVSPKPQVGLNSKAYHTEEEYRSAAIPALSAFKNRNKLSFDGSNVIDELKIKYPEIIDGEVDLPVFGHQPKIILQIAAPKLFLNSQGTDFVIDSEGRAVAKKIAMPDVKGLPLVIDQTGYVISQGESVLSASEVAFVNQLVKQCKKSDIPISSIILPAKAMEMDLKTGDRSYFVKFHLAGEPVVQIGQFIAARGQFDKKHIKPKQYLDVRVAGKVYYK